MCHGARPRGDPERGLFLEWAEMSSRERKPLICRALCRSISFVTNQSPAVERGFRTAPFDRDNHASKAGTSAGEGSAYLFFDVKSICHRLFIPTTSPRRGEVGRMPGEGDPPPRRHQSTRTCQSGTPMRPRQTLHQPTRCATPAHSVSIYYNAVFFKFRKCTYSVRGMKSDRNILSRTDLNFSENSRNNTVGARHSVNRRPFLRQLFSQLATRRIWTGDDRDRPDNR